MPERGTLAYVLVHVGIASALVVAFAFVAVGVRGVAIRSVRQDLEAREARDADLARRAAADPSPAEQSAILEQALKDATMDIIDPVASGRWRVATWVALVLLWIAVFLGSAWVMSRTDWLPAGILVYLVGVAAWVAIAFVAHSVLSGLPAVREIIESGSQTGRSAFPVRYRMRLLDLIVGGIAFDASVVLRSLVVFALPAYAGIGAGRKLAVATRSDRDFEPVLFEPQGGATHMAEQAVELRVSEAPRRPTMPASWDPVAGAVPAASTLGLATEGAAVSSGLCPRCGAVNSPRNAACVMCETALQ